MQAQERTSENRLTIELVPQTCWFSNVRLEVGTAEWDRLRKLASDAAEDRCQVCGGRGPKLIALCPACHEVKHIGLANIKGQGNIAARHLAKAKQVSVDAKPRLARTEWVTVSKPKRGENRV